MVRAAPQKVMLNKPVAVGFSVLELSKLSMYEFYYDYMKPKYENRCKLLFTDTDSLCCEIQTSDIYRDMGEAAHLYDTSNFDPTHPRTLKNVINTVDGYNIFIFSCNCFATETIYLPFCWTIFQTIFHKLKLNKNTVKNALKMQVRSAQPHRTT